VWRPVRRRRHLESAGRVRTHNYPDEARLDIRKPPKTQYKISEFRKTQPNAIQGPSHAPGTSEIQGIAKGSNRMPDSPESAGFFDATKNTQAKTPAADNKKKPAASMPPRENFSEGIIVLQPNGLAHWRRATGAILARQNHNICKNRDSDRPAASAAICQASLRFYFETIGCSSNCGASPPMWSHGAFDPTNMCIAISMPGSPSTHPRVKP